MEDSPELAQLMHHLQSSSSTSAQPSLPESTATPGLLPNGKKTKGRVKIKMEYIGNKLRRYTTFSKRKTGIMKKDIFLCLWHPLASSAVSTEF
ncbi:hypothetical protein Y032_0303g1896 [Ancylostoma ceylanicum]|uniref:MADS-box domain-containing protein n=1 Tax=Ancylostoma ceylanicum TaxID=53326 RepID=A0A016S4L6_9BILA|nr:hypothetical protein Y032_0303g1896 [Ancylostoma ceylanicum]